MNWTDSENRQTDSDPQTRKFGFEGLWTFGLIWTKFGLNGKLNPRPETGFKDLDLRPGQNMMSTVAPLCHF